MVLVVAIFSSMVLRQYTDKPFELIASFKDEEGFLFAYSQKVSQ